MQSTSISTESHSYLVFLCPFLSYSVIQLAYQIKSTLYILVFFYVQFCSNLHHLICTSSMTPPSTGESYIGKKLSLGVNLLTNTVGQNGSVWSLRVRTGVTSMLQAVRPSVWHGTEIVCPLGECPKVCQNVPWVSAWIGSAAEWLVHYSHYY